MEWEYKNVTIVGDPEAHIGQLAMMGGERWECYSIAMTVKKKRMNGNSGPILYTDDAVAYFFKRPKQAPRTRAD